MAKVLIVYSHKFGHTELMAYAIAQGVKDANAQAIVKHVKNTHPGDLAEADAIIFGSPTYYGLPSADMKKLLDESVSLHGQLNGKVGGAFTSSANIGGGNETTILALIQAMMVHGMIIQGSSTGNHYGPVSINKPDAIVRRQCHEYGQLVAKLADKILEPEEVSSP
jgi:NAD(P)H dehydrogenase (quinone)